MRAIGTLGVARAALARERGDTTMAIRTKGWLLAGVTALMAVTSVPSSAAFVDVATVIADTGGTFGPGGGPTPGKDQSNVGPSAGSDDTLLAFALFNDATSPVVLDQSQFPSANLDTVRDAARDFLNKFNINPFDSTGQSELGRLGVPDSVFQTSIGGCDPGSGTSCNLDIGMSFAYNLVNYLNVYALFGEGGDNLIHFDLGDGNLGTSNLTVLTLLPAAAWMFLGGLGVVGGALKWRRRAATATD